jgi:hypothetical protein
MLLTTTSVYHAQNEAGSVAAGVAKPKEGKDDSRAREHGSLSPAVVGARHQTIGCTAWVRCWKVKSQAALEPPNLLSSAPVRDPRVDERRLDRSCPRWSWTKSIGSPASITWVATGWRMSAHGDGRVAGVTRVTILRSARRGAWRGRQGPRTLPHPGPGRPRQYAIGGPSMQSSPMSRPPTSMLSGGLRT